MPVVYSDVLVLAGDMQCVCKKPISWAAHALINQGRLVIHVASQHESYERKCQSEHGYIKAMHKP